MLMLFLFHYGINGSYSWLAVLLNLGPKHHTEHFEGQTVPILYSRWYRVSLIDKEFEVKGILGVVKNLNEISGTVVFYFLGFPGSLRYTINSKLVKKQKRGRKMNNSEIGD